MELPAAAEALPWSYQLRPIFQSASAQYNVPLPLLLTLAYYGSAFENRGSYPTIEGGYGVMALRKNDLGGKSLSEAAALIGATEDDLKTKGDLNITGAAAVLASYAKMLQIDRSKGLEGWLDVVIKYAGLDADSSRFFAMEVYEKLHRGLDVVNSSGERFTFGAQDIGALKPASLLPSSIRVQSSDYGPAVWSPAASCNYSTAWGDKDTVVCHTIEGSAAGAVSWFRNCNAEVSAHYVVAESGTVYQCVSEGQTAWHVGCYNYRAIGIEHEGYAASASHPASLYDASALLTRHLCDAWGIPKEKRTTGPGIVGHIDITRCCCGSHTDPGNGWDWGYYISQVQGTPPVPAYSAGYNAQSYPATMTAGSTAIAWAEWRNNGSSTWTHSATYIGTSSPEDRASPFYNSANWVSANRASDVDQSSVGQGDIGRFTFILKAPSTPGVYVEKYKLVQEGVTWFGDEITWTITVTANNGNITGTVRNSASGQGLAGATVAIGGGSSTTTSDSGVYTFNDLAPGTYTLTASKAGFASASDSVAVTAGQTTTKDFSLSSTDNTPPSAPTGLTATGISPSQIDLSWTASTDTGGAGLAGYIVYLNGAEAVRTTATTYSDNGLSQNTSYSYYIKAYDGANNISTASNTASAATKPGTVPIFEDGFGQIDGNLWQAIIQSPMPAANPLVLDGSYNHGTFAGGNSIRTVDSTNSNQGCLLGHAFNPGFGAAKFESYFYDTATSNNSRQGMEVRCLDNNGGVKGIYYIGTYSVAPGSYGTYSAGYYKVCGSGCTGWYWPLAAKVARSVGWHKLTLDFQPYTSAGAGSAVHAYIDGVEMGTMERTLDTQTYGLKMICYGYHYRVNQQGWFDDCAMYASPPAAPTMSAPAALSTSAIRWSVTDNSNNEMGFKVVDASQAAVASAGVSNETGGSVVMDETGLPANTPCTRTVKAYNGTLDSLPTAPATRWTLSTPPSASTVTCDKATGWSSSPVFTFTAANGFGQGTVAKYLWAWDTNPTHNWTGSESTWNSGAMIVNAPAAGSYYLHVQGFNGEDVPNGTADLGPYSFQSEPPTNPTSAVETHGAQDGVWQSTVSSPSFTWSGATAGSGIAGYLVYFGADQTGTSATYVTSAGYGPGAVDTGTYYLRVCSKDNTGALADEWSTLFTFKYDGSAPSTPAVTDDGNYSGSKSKLHAKWSSADADSGIAEYQYAVGKSAGATDVVGWASAGNAPDAVIAIPDPGLEIGQTYFISAKAKNSAGAWSEVGSADGIQLAPAVETIAEAKALTDTTPVALTNKSVTASFPASFYIEDANRTSGIMVFAPGPNIGSLVTVGGVMGVNAAGERAVLDPVVTIEAGASPASTIPPLFMSVGSLGGSAFNSFTVGKTDGVGLNTVGLLVKVCGSVRSIGEHEFTISDGALCGPITVVVTGAELPTLTEGDFVSVVGVCSLRLDGARVPIVRASDADAVKKLN